MSSTPMMSVGVDQAVASTLIVDDCEVYTSYQTVDDDAHNLGNTSYEKGVQIVTEETGHWTSVTTELVEGEELEIDGPVDWSQNTTDQGILITPWPVKDEPGDHIKSRTRCVVCKDNSRNDLLDLRYSLSAASNTPLEQLLTSLVLRNQSQGCKLTNTNACGICRDLLDRADELQEQMKTFQSELTSITERLARNITIGEANKKYNKNLEKISMDNDSYLDNFGMDSPEDEDRKPIISEIHKPSIESSIPSTSKSNFSRVDPAVIEELGINNTMKCRFCLPPRKRFNNYEVLSAHFDQVHSSQSHVKCKLCHNDLSGGIKHYLLHMASTHPDVEVKPGQAVLLVEKSNLKRKAKLKMKSEPKEEKRGRPKKKRVRLMESLPEGQPVNKYQVRCPICETVVRNENFLKHAIEHHTKEKLVQCPYCPEKFQKRCHYDLHRRKIHVKEKKEKTMKCSYCPKLFFNACHLNIHIKTVHENKREFLCSECGAGYKNRAALTVHLRSHSGDRPYVCKLCSKSFARTGSIKKHLRTVHHLETNWRLNDPLIDTSEIPVFISK